MIPDGCTSMRCSHAQSLCRGCRRVERECALDDHGECWRCSLPRWEAYLANDDRNIASPRAVRWGACELVIDDAPPARRGKR